MISQDDIQWIKDNVAVLDVAQRLGVEMHRAGANYVGRCPFHNEKTGSFNIRPSRNDWHCFGCGKGGNVIDFYMQHRGCSFVEAVKDLADMVGHTLTDDHTETEEERHVRAKRQSQFEVNKLAAHWFEEQLRKEPRAMEYCQNRGWSEETLEQWGIGYAPASWDALYRYLREECKVKMEALMESPLFSANRQGGYYCKFRERLMFPVYDLHGEVAGFSGRTVSWAEPIKTTEGMKAPAKYINTSGSKKENDPSDVYRKSELLFGWNFARAEAAKVGEAIIVEGNPDAIRLHSIGVARACAPCGTAFTEQQAQILKRTVRQVTLIYDSDGAGQKATMRTGEVAAMAGLAVNILTLPDMTDEDGKPLTDEDGKPQKHDPDTFFTSREQYEQYAAKNKRSWYQYWAETKRRELGNDPDPSMETEVMKKMVPILAARDAEEQGAIIALLAKHIGNRTRWKQLLKITAEEAERKKKADGYSKEQIDMIDRYGFCMRGNCYHIQSSPESGYREVSNFVLEPLFHIESTVNAKRLYRLRNNRGVVKVLEIAQKDLVSLSAFKTRTESFGNFLFTGSDTDLNKIKAYLYETTRSCREVVQLGWQKEGFFAWSNGLSLESGEFLPIDELGTVTVGKSSYYMPALSEYYAADDELFAYERSFINTDNPDADLRTLATMMRRSYGDNAVVGLGYYLATLFRDVVFGKFGEFPLLNIFGQKNTGKSTMAMTLTRLFGCNSKPGDIFETSTTPGIAQNLKLCCNALFHIDEYKNAVDPQKIGLLKAIYNSKGRTRMNWEKGQQSETTKVDCGVILTGQEVPNADPALFRRLIFLTVSKTKFGDQETVWLEELKAYEKRGLTGITCQLLREREWVKAHYADSYEAVRDEMKQFIRLGNISSASLWKNWLYVLSMYHCLDGRIDLPWSYAEAVPIFAEGIRKQNAANMEYDEVGDFWHGVESMLTNGDVENDYDLMLRFDRSDITLDIEGGKRTYTQSYDMLYLNPDRLFDLYAQHCKRTKDNKGGLLGKSSLSHYLTTSDSFMGKTRRKFKVPTKLRQNPGEGKIFTETGGQLTALYKSAYALVFNYRMLQDQYGIDLDVKSDVVEGVPEVEVPY